MDPIKNIELGTLLIEVKNEAFKEQRNKIRDKINTIYGRTIQAAGSVRKLESDLAKARAALAREEAKLARIEAGDWSGLPQEGDGQATA